MAMSVDAKLLKQTKFPPEFNQKVDMKKVNVEVMKKYVWSMFDLYLPGPIPPMIQRTDKFNVDGLPVRYQRS